MSPAPVLRNESATGCVWKRAMMLPTAVEAFKLPPTLVNRMAPPALSHAAPEDEPTWMGPPEFLAVTIPLAYPTSIGPPPVSAMTRLPAGKMRIAPPMVEQRT